MKSFRLLAALVLAVTALAVAPKVHAQYASVNCAPSTACNSSTGPSNTNTGDQAWQAFGKINANFGLLGTFAVANAATPPAIGSTTPGAGNFSTLGATSTLTTNIVGSTQCVHANTSGVLSGTGADCGSGGGGGGSFSALTSGSNTAAAMTVGTGASLAFAGAGTIAASSSTSLTALTGMPSQAAASVVANVTGGATAPTAVLLPAFQTAMIAATAQLVTDSPATGPTNDYNASGGLNGSTAVLYLTPASGGSTFNGMAAGSAMQEVLIVNAEAAGGADRIFLVNQSSSDSTAANRFFTSATTSLAIPAGGGVSCVYLASSVNRWWCR